MRKGGTNKRASPVGAGPVDVEALKGLEVIRGAEAVAEVVVLADVLADVCVDGEVLVQVEARPETQLGEVIGIEAAIVDREVGDEVASAGYERHVFGNSGAEAEAEADHVVVLVAIDFLQCVTEFNIHGRCGARVDAEANADSVVVVGAIVVGASERGDGEKVRDATEGHGSIEAAGGVAVVTAHIAGAELVI